MVTIIFQVTQWWKIFGEIECLALIIACLCHDLDHRGTNNSFQIKWAFKFDLSDQHRKKKFSKKFTKSTRMTIFFFFLSLGSLIFFFFNSVFRASSPLAQLYSTSTMEHHHFDQCIMILNSQGNQILGNVSSDEYARIIKILEDAILSTDLAVYFRYLLIFSNLFV